MRYASNAKIIRVSKLLTGMGDLNVKYDPKNVYSNSEHLESEDDTDIVKKLSEPLIMFAFHTTNNIIKSDFDSICYLYISSKQTRIVNHRKSMTKAKKKLEEVCVNL